LHREGSRTDTDAVTIEFPQLRVRRSRPPIGAPDLTALTPDTLRGPSPLSTYKKIARKPHQRIISRIQGICPISLNRHFVNIAYTESGRFTRTDRLYILNPGDSRAPIYCIYRIREIHAYRHCIYRVYCLLYRARIQGAYTPTLYIPRLLSNIPSTNTRCIHTDIVYTACTV